LATNQTKPYKFLTAAWAVLAAGLAIPLVIFILTGFQTRYIADDYCTAAVFQRYGWWGMQVQSYQSVLLYAGNRFTLTLLVSLGDIFGPLSVTVYPGLILLLWVGGNLFFMRSLRSGDQKMGWLPALVLSEFIVWFAITLAPNRFQDFYWRQAMLPYLAPFPFAAWLAGLVLRQRRAARANYFVWMIIGILGLLAGGLSETGVAVIFPAAFLVLVAAVITRWVLHEKDGYLLQAAAIAFIGVFIALILVVSAPMNLERMSFYTDRLSLPDMLRMIWQEGWLGFRMFLWQYPSSFLLLVVLSGAAGYTLATHNAPARRENWKVHLAGLAIIPLLILVFSLAASAPAVYAQGSGPEPRARFVTLGVVVMGWVWFGMKSGWLAGHWTRLNPTRWFVPLLTGVIVFTLIFIFMLNPIPAGESNLRDWRAALNPVTLLAAIGVVILSVFATDRINRGKFTRGSAAAVLAIGVTAFSAIPVLQIPNLLPDYRNYQQRAALWDARDAEIRASAAQGVQSLTIPGLDSLSGVVELREESYWVNNCAEWYYGIPTIEAKEMNLPAGVKP